jgi:hypothetical protein
MPDDQEQSKSLPYTEPHEETPTVFPQSSAPAPATPQAFQPLTPAASQPVETVPDANVWISKEEYERLRGAEQLLQSADVGTVTSVRPVGKLQIATLILAALSVLAGLMAPGLDYLLVLGILVLLISAGYSYADYMQAKKNNGYIQPHKIRNRVLFFAALTVLLLPVLMVVAAIVFFMIVCAAGGCRGS